jgi:hypothetical protein
MNATASNVGGVDVAKNVFQAYWIAAETGEIKNVQIKRTKFLEHFVNRAQWLWVWRPVAERGTGREFAAWLGLVPAHIGTGGKIRRFCRNKRMLVSQP